MGPCPWCSPATGQVPDPCGSTTICENKSVFVRKEDRHGKFQQTNTCQHTARLTTHFLSRAVSWWCLGLCLGLDLYLRRTFLGCAPEKVQRDFACAQQQLPISTRLPSRHEHGYVWYTVQHLHCCSWMPQFGPRMVWIYLQILCAKHFFFLKGGGGGTCAHKKKTWHGLKKWFIISAVYFLIGNK